MSMRGRIDIKGKESMVTYFVVDSARNKSLEANFDEASSVHENNDDDDLGGDHSERTARSNRSVRTTHTIVDEDARSTHSTHSDFLNFLRESIAEDSDEESFHGGDDE